MSTYTRRGRGVHSSTYPTERTSSDLSSSSTVFSSTSEETSKIFTEYTNNEKSGSTNDKMEPTAKNNLSQAYLGFRETAEAPSQVFSSSALDMFTTFKNTWFRMFTASSRISQRITNEEINFSEFPKLTNTENQYEASFGSFISEDTPSNLYRIFTNDLFSSIESSSEIITIDSENLVASLRKEFSSSKLYERTSSIASENINGTFDEYSSYIEEFSETLTVATPNFEESSSQNSELILDNQQTFDDKELVSSTIDEMTSTVSVNISQTFEYSVSSEISKQVSDESIVVNDSVESRFQNLKIISEHLPPVNDEDKNLSSVQMDEINSLSQTNFAQLLTEYPVSTEISEHFSETSSGFFLKESTSCNSITISGGLKVFTDEESGLDEFSENLSVNRNETALPSLSLREELVPELTTPPSNVFYTFTETSSQVFNYTSENLSRLQSEFIEPPQMLSTVSVNMSEAFNSRYVTKETLTPLSSNSSPSSSTMEEVPFEQFYNTYASLNNDGYWFPKFNKATLSPIIGEDLSIKNASEKYSEIVSDFQEFYPEIFGGVSKMSYTTVSIYPSLIEMLFRVSKNLSQTTDGI